MLEIGAFKFDKRFVYRILLFRARLGVGWVFGFRMLGFWVVDFW